MNAAVRKTIKHWGYVLPYICIPRNDSEYEKLLRVIDELMKVSRQKKDERITTLLKLIGKNIEQYEKQHYSTKPLSGAEMLEFLMEEHSLGQGDLPEIGGQSLISKILSGERQLTAGHIRYLSKRFGVSPAVFL